MLAHKTKMTSKEVIKKRLKNKKEKLEQLKKERLQADGFFDYFTRKSLTEEIHLLEKEIEQLAEQVEEEESFSEKAVNVINEAVNNLFGNQAEKQKLTKKVERNTHADAIREKYHLGK